MRHGYTLLAAAGLSMGGAIAQDPHTCCNNQTITAILIEKGVIAPEDLLAAPVADFAGTPTTGNAPLTVTFKDRSIGTVSSWSWRFGDGTGSSDQNPSHTYSTKGTYTVVLKASGPGGSDTTTRPGWIRVTNLPPLPPLPPTADFSFTPTTGNAPLTVAFKDRSTGAVSSRSWKFGDGTESSEQNPSHTYSAEGIYTAALTVDGPGGSNTATGLNSINVTNPPPPPYVRASLPGRKYLRGGLGSADQEWSSRGPYWSGSGDTVFVEGATDMTESLYAFAEYEEFSSSDQFVQDTMIGGAGWDTQLNEDVEAGLKLGFSHLSSSYFTPGGSLGDTQTDSLFVGGSVRYLLGEQLIGELELWKGPKMDALSARIEWLLEQRYGFFLQSLTRGDYSGLRFGLSLFF
jgi:PKD repeat protein